MIEAVLSHQDREQIDGISDEFEASWPADIALHLSRVEERLRGPLLRELVAIDVERRSDSGETCSPDEYRRRFPNFSDVIAAVFLPSDPLSSISLTATLDLPGESTRPVPARLGRYEILRVLGEGGYGVVYLARDPKLGREVAIKAPLPSALEYAGLESYLAEAQMVAGLEIPGIVPVYDVGHDEEQCFVVSMYLAGGSVQALANGPRPSFDLVAKLVAQTARILHAAHKKGVFHCDIKPANILLDEAGAPHVTDFGLSLHESQQRRHAGRVAGTPLYMSPEQVRGDIHLADGRIDIWALGVTLYQLLTGRFPFNGKMRDEVFDRIGRQDPKPPRMIDDTIPARLEQVVLKCLAKSPQERYSTALDLAQDLERWRAEATAPLRRRWTPWMIVGSAVLAIVAWGLTRPNPAAAPLGVVAQAPMPLTISAWSDGRFVDLSNVAPARSGTALRVSCEVPEGLHGQIFSINAKGRVQLLAQLSSQASDRWLHFPAADQASPLQGPTGTELILACASARPLLADQVESLLKPDLPLPSVRDETLIRVAIDDVAFEQKGRDFGPARQAIDPDEDALRRLRSVQNVLAAHCQELRGLAFSHTAGE